MAKSPFAPGDKIGWKPFGASASEWRRGMITFFPSTLGRKYVRILLEGKAETEHHVAWGTLVPWSEAKVLRREEGYDGLREGIYSEMRELQTALLEVLSRVYKKPEVDLDIANEEWTITLSMGQAVELVGVLHEATADEGTCAPGCAVEGEHTQCFGKLERGKHPLAD